MHPSFRWLIWPTCLFPFSAIAQTSVLPDIRLDPQDIISSKVTEFGQRSITVQKLDPVRMEEKVPAASFRMAPPATATAGEAGSQGSDEVSALKPSRTFSFGASVYIQDNSRPEDAVTDLHFPATNGRPAVSFWVKANFLWMSGFSRVEGENEDLDYFMVVSAVTGKLPADVAAEDWTTSHYRLAEGTPTEEQVAVVQRLLDFYHAPGRQERLRTAYEARQRESALHAAERAANPPEAKGLIIRHWRLDASGRPGTSAAGGAR